MSNLEGLDDYRPRGLRCNRLGKAQGRPITDDRPAKQALSDLAIRGVHESCNSHQCLHSDPRCGGTAVYLVDHLDGYLCQRQKPAHRDGRYMFAPRLRGILAVHGPPFTAKAHQTVRWTPWTFLGFQQVKGRFNDQ